MHTQPTWVVWDSLHTGLPTKTSPKRRGSLSRHGRSTLPLANTTQSRTSGHGAQDFAQGVDPSVGMAHSTLPLANTTHQRHGTQHCASGSESPNSKHGTTVHSAPGSKSLFRQHGTSVHSAPGSKSLNRQNDTAVHCAPDSDSLFRQHGTSVHCAPGEAVSLRDMV